ncbi:MAG: hypothetical protein HZB53_07320 [Chloroflexi bacterium]|nr:hypothetical protein [Chloroflexota bacterium]
MVLKVLSFFTRAIKSFVWGVGLCLALTLAATPDHFAPADRFDVYLRTVAPEYRFDLATWIVSAFVGKLGDRFPDATSTWSTAQRQELVDHYFALAAEEEQLRGKLLQQTAASAPAGELAALDKQVAAKRSEKLALEHDAERIIAEQIEHSAQAEGLTYDLPLNPQIILPPVAFKFVAPPLLLVMSPPDHIMQKKTVQLQPAMSIGEQERVEGQADRLNVVSLVVPIGGMGTYPTMVLETSSKEWTMEVVAHEWTHNYLDTRPLGMNYAEEADNGVMRTINETVANISGQELALRARGLPPPDYADKPDRPRASSPQPRTPPEFDYNREMRDTYAAVQSLLKDGKIAEAADYMEERRKLFVSHGHALRKLNQAYFAFYGSYATGDGVGAENPIGGELTRLRRASGSLKAFLDNIAYVSNFKEYRALLRRLGVPEGKR